MAAGVRGSGGLADEGVVAGEAVIEEGGSVAEVGPEGFGSGGGEGGAGVVAEDEGFLDDDRGGGGLPVDAGVA